MDLQKAFDTVNISILIEKLQHYGVRGTCIEWFKSYLVGRVQHTCVNGVLSKPRISECGVPQGTVLGPLLFIIYINDIANATVNSKLKLFADDSHIFIISNNVTSLFSIANSGLSSISVWFNANKLHINYDKTKYMIFDTMSKADKVHYCELKFGNYIIDRVKCTKYLGVIIDETLS